MSDWYLKAVLTVIAGALVVIVAQIASPPVVAQSGIKKYTMDLSGNGRVAWKLETSTGKLEFCLIRRAQETRYNAECKAVK